MDENERPEKQDNLAYIVYEAAMARGERTIKRLFVIIILLIVLLVGTNAAWLYYESTFEEVTTVTETYEATAEGEGTAVLNGDGSVIIDGHS